MGQAMMLVKLKILSWDKWGQKIKSTAEMSYLCKSSLKLNNKMGQSSPLMQGRKLDMSSYNHHKNYQFFFLKKMKQAILSWSHPPLFIPKLSPTSTFPIPQKTIPLRVYATVESSPKENLLTAKERRQMRNERRESKTGYNWKEEVEERLIKKPKKQYKSWTEELNLDNLAKLGPQWWVVRVSRVTGHETAERMARALARNFPNIDFQVDND